MLRHCFALESIFHPPKMRSGTYLRRPYSAEKAKAEQKTCFALGMQKRTIRSAVVRLIQRARRPLLGASCGPCISTYCKQCRQHVGQQWHQRTLPKQTNRRLAIFAPAASAAGNGRGQMIRSPLARHLQYHLKARMCFQHCFLCRCTPKMQEVHPHPDTQKSSLVSLQVCHGLRRKLLLQLRRQRDAREY